VQLSIYRPSHQRQDWLRCPEGQKQMSMELSLVAQVSAIHITA
jgi:hypothetical protein